MSESLRRLEQHRAGLLRQISELGDFRPGSITATGGRCGSSGCHCHRPNDPGHSPHPRLTYKANGKTVSESLPARRLSVRPSVRSTPSGAGNS